MRKNKAAKLICLIPALFASILDITVTIVHQDPEYWQGNLSKANEGNPLGAVLMANSVYGLFLISGIWIAIIIVAGYYLPRLVSRIFILFVVIAHSYGASTWISSRYGFWWAMLVIFTNALIYVLVEERAKARSSEFS
ncbi:MAG: hypothetical protein AAF363_00780 [Bacteroidota bacterium]